MELEDNKSIKEDYPILSIIITSYTFDRKTSLISLLESVNNQTFRLIETILVIEQSMQLYNFVSEYTKRQSYENMKVIYNDGQLGASAARNLGIQASKGRIIGFVDDDVVLSADWAGEMIKTYDDSIIGVSGATLPLWECPKPKWLPGQFYWLIGCTEKKSDNAITEIRNVWTVNSSFKQEVFNKGVLFSTEIGPLGGSMKGREKNKISEDLELSLRAREKTGGKIVFNPKVVVYHRVPKERLKWRFIIRWSYWIGSSRKALKRLYPKSKSRNSVLSTEYNLLSDIFTRLFPSILMGIFTDPITALHKFALTVTVLSCVAVGYVRSSIFN